MAIEIVEPYMFVRGTPYSETDFPVDVIIGEEVIGAAQVRNTGTTVVSVTFTVSLRDPSGQTRQSKSATFNLSPGQQYGLYSGDSMMVVDKAGTWQLCATATNATSKTWNAVQVASGEVYTLDVSVKDEDGYPLHSVLVTVASAGIYYERYTDGGAVVFPPLPADVYTVTCSKAGYNTDQFTADLRAGSKSVTRTLTAGEAGADWKKWLKWGAIGIGTILGVIAIVKLVKAKRGRHG